jgi:polysaccharide pyruvyl transferase WcaK-like protein
MLVGYYGFGNAGDEALLFSLRRLLGDVDVTIASGDPELTRSVHPGAHVTLVNGADTIVSAADTDLVIFGGGHLLCDTFIPFRSESVLTTRSAGLSAYASIAMSAALSGVPYVIWGVGAGPIIAADARAVVRDLVKHATDITVRDEQSAHDVASLGAPAPEVTGCPALLLSESDFPIPSDPPDLAVAMMPWQRPVEETAQQVHSLLKALPSGLDIALVPIKVPRSGISDDMKIARLSAEHTQARVIEGTWAERLGVIYSAKAVVAMRYHAILTAILANRPFLAISYEPKITSLATTFSDASAVADFSELGDGLAPRVLQLLNQGTGKVDGAVLRALRATLRKRLQWPLIQPEKLAAGRAWAAQMLIASDPWKRSFDME